MEEAENAFKELKRYLSSSLILTPSNKTKDLFLYIATIPQVVRIVLVVERESPKKKAKIQIPIYNVSEVLHDVKLQYPM